MSNDKLNTHLAAKCYVMSTLRRLGANAALTLGIESTVDIVVDKKGTLLTLDVKGLKDKGNFPFDNCTIRQKYHYYIFVSFLNKITDTGMVPEVYIVPSLDLDKPHKELEGKKFVFCSPQGLKRVQYGTLEKLSKKYLNNWDVFM